MRVVLLGNNPSRRPGDPSALALEALAAALERRGIDVGVIFPSKPVPEGDAFLAALRHPGGWLSLSQHRRALRRTIETELAAGADLFHAHSWFPAAVAAPPDVPLVLTAYGADADVLRGSRRARRLAQPLFARAAIVSAASREVGDTVQNVTGRHVSRGQVQLMPVDTRAWPWTAGGGGAVAVAELITSQRLELAIHTIAVLASCGHALPLTIIGEGPLRQELARVASLNGVETLVRFVGAASSDEILHCLAAADLMLHPARGATAAPWVLAAVLMGIPIVACWDGGVVVELVSETGAGRLTLPSIEALSDAVLGLLMDPDRVALARLVGESWRARVAPDHVAEIVEHWYREALGG